MLSALHGRGLAGFGGPLTQVGGGTEAGAREDYSVICFLSRWYVCLTLHARTHKECQGTRLPVPAS